MCLRFELKFLSTIQIAHKLHRALRVATVASTKSFAQLVQLLGKTAAKTYINNVPHGDIELRSAPQPR